MNRFAPAVMAVLLITGCTTARQSSAPVPPVVQSTPAPDAQLSSESGLRVQQCRQQLDALQAYDLKVYYYHKARLDRVTGQLNKYLEIEKSIGDDINDLAMPKYQFAVRSACFGIKNALAQLIIKES